MSLPLAAYASLGAAIVCEVLGTTFLQKSEQFTKLVPTLAMAGFYAASLFFLSQALKGIPLGVAYAIWAGLGIVLTAVISVTIFNHTLDLAAMAGIALIIAGVMVINLFSQSISH